MAIITKDLGKVTPDIDTTLTQSGQAADAKVTGDEINDLKEDLSQKAPVIINASDEAEVVTFADGAEGMPLKSMTFDFAENQSGYGAVTVKRSGKNLIQFPYQSGDTLVSNGITWTVNADGSVTANGTATGTSLYWLYGTSTSPLMPTLEEGEEVFYTINGKASHDGINGQIVFYGGTAVTLSSSINALTIPSMSTHTGMVVILRIAKGTTVDNVTVYPMIRRATDNDSTYELYTGYDAYTITLPQTVYGGEITINNPGVTTLLGSNTIWMNADGTIQCEYPADTKLYIDALTAPDDDMIADSNIASGKYFTVNNRLYLSTTAIAQGEAIVVGTNCTQTDLATALNALNA